MTALVTAAVMMANPMAGYAQTPSSLSDLVGWRGSSFEGEMGQRGYEFIKKEGVAQFWWSKNSSACVSAAFDDGRVSSIQSTAAGDCGQSNSSNSNSKSNNNAALVGVAIGVAAIGLIAALSGHHKDDSSRNTSEYNTEYERGYNAGMNGNQYDNNDSEAYHSGYMAGEAEKNNRRHANSTLVRGAPAAAQNACKQRGDETWDIPAGSTVPVSVYDYGQGNYEVTVASGHRRAKCSVNSQGVISDFLPQ